MIGDVDLTGALLLAPNLVGVANWGFFERDSFVGLDGRAVKSPQRVERHILASRLAK